MSAYTITLNMLNFLIKKLCVWYSIFLLKIDETIIILGMFFCQNV